MLKSKKFQKDVIITKSILAGIILRNCVMEETG